MADKPARVVLIGSEIEENLAIRYLAASLVARGHDAYITPCSCRSDFDHVAAEVGRKRPQMVAISMAFQMHALMYLELAAKLRHTGYTGHIIVGGHFPTFEFRHILREYPAVDSVGRFEGEETIVALADALATNADLSMVPNLVYRVDGELRENECRCAFPDLDTLPFPTRSARMQQRLGENFATLVSSRGCWHSACVYCCIGAFHRSKQKPFALRSAENVAREIAELFEHHNVRLFQFHDDNFPLPTKDKTLARLEALADALKAAGGDPNALGFIIKARPDQLDEDVGDALQALGCTGVFLGIENASASGLAALHRATTIEGVEQALAVLKARRIAVTYNLLVFHPRAQREEYSQNVRFVAAHDSLPFDFGRAEIVAGSPLEEDVRTLRLLRGSWPRWDYALRDPAMQRVFETFRYVFRRPDSPYTAAAHSNIAMAYHSALVQKLYPGPTASTFAAECEAATRTWNRCIVNAMQETLDVSSRDDRVERMESIRLKVDDEAKNLLAKAQQLQIPIGKYQRLRKTFRRFGVEDAVEGSRLVRKLLKC